MSTKVVVVQVSVVRYQ